MLFRLKKKKKKNRENFLVDLIISIYLFIQQILFVRIPARRLVHLIVGSCIFYRFYNTSCDHPTVTLLPACESTTTTINICAKFLDASQESRENSYRNVETSPIFLYSFSCIKK
ncbi:hypothetical protein V1478_002014 [Vespula squamosa]|uniref:Uncharacterized protein n=1 Tax=Vespula squamosa TaxID=30214 RepID=A0ABD2C0E0_VESSQ